MESTDILEGRAPSAEAAAPPPPILASTDAPEVRTTDGAGEPPTDRGLSLLIFALRTRELSLIDTNLLREAAIEFVSAVRAEFEDVRLDPTFLAEVSASLTSAPARIAAAAGRLATVRPHLRIPAPHLSLPRPVRTARVKAVVPKQPAAPRAPRVSGRPAIRVRWGRVMFRGLSLGLIAAVFVALPAEVIQNVANEVSTTIGELSSNISSTISEKLAAAPSTPALARATFELPPLSAYKAAFESQAPYPTARPNTTVEWVVALRNTGSVGWYRGIDGAQASLALTDGTTAGVQTTPYVGPGQVGWFVVHFPAAPQAGVSKVSLLPRIDGRGRLPDLGIYVAVTVSPNP